MTYIDNSAFYGCTSLTSFTIPNSVTYIGNSAFYGCTSLTSFTIPNSVKEIYSNTFEGCSGLTSVTLGKSMEYIAIDTFKDCSGLTSVISLIENPFIIISVFPQDVYSHAILYVPTGTIGKYRAVYGWKDFLFIEEGVPNGILQTLTDGTEKKAAYRIDGMRKTKLFDGINIIRYADGTKKKVIVK